MPNLSTSCVSEGDVARVEEYEEENCEHKSEAVAELIDSGLRAEGYKPTAPGETAKSAAMYSLVTALTWFGLYAAVNRGTIIWGAGIMISAAFALSIIGEAQAQGAIPSTRGELRRRVRRWV